MRLRFLLPFCVAAAGASLPASAASPLTPGQKTAAAVAAWGRHSTVSLAGVTVNGLAQDASGRVLAVGYKQWNSAEWGVVVGLRRDGSPDPEFGKNGFARAPALDQLGWDDAVVLPGGGIVVAGTTSFGIVGDDLSARLVLSELDSHGRMVRSFGRGGIFETAPDSCVHGPTALALEGKKILVAVFRECTDKSPQTTELLRLDADGTLDKTFGRNGAVEIARVLNFGGPTPLLVDGDRILIATPDPAGGTIELRRLTADGSLDRTFRRHSGIARVRVAEESKYQTSVNGLFLAKLGRYTVTGCTRSGPFIARFNSGGSPYRFWAGSSNFDLTNVEHFAGGFGARCATFAQLPNHKLVAAGTALVRLFPTGVLDPFHPTVLLPLFQFPLHELFVTREGALLVVTNRHDKSALIGAYHF